MVRFKSVSTAFATVAFFLVTIVAVACSAAATPTPVMQTVVVELDEWSVRPDKTSVSAGDVTFEARNVGTIAHELVVLKTDLAADELVLEGTQVSEEASGELIGEIEEDELGPGQSTANTFGLASGKYVLFCNIPGHYQSGMLADFEVR